jgi:hypothetical protein
VAAWTVSRAEASNSGRRAMSVILAPRSASKTAIAKPIPLEPPVMMAWSAILDSGGCFLVMASSCCFSFDAFCQNATRFWNHFHTPVETARSRRCGGRLAIKMGLEFSVCGSLDVDPSPNQDSYTEILFRVIHGGS